MNKWSNEWMNEIDFSGKLKKNVYQYKVPVKIISLKRMNSLQKMECNKNL